VTDSGRPEEVTSLRIRSEAKNSESLEQHVDALRRQIRGEPNEAILREIGALHKIHLSCYVACDDDFPLLYLPTEQLRWLLSFNAAVGIDVNRWSRAKD